ncbi:MAG: DoxX family protein [Gemmatimonadales bacterium]
MSQKLDWIIRLVVVAALAIIGVIPKVTGDPATVANFTRWGYPDGFYRIVGLAEVIAAILLLIPRTALIGAVGVVAVMLGAVGTHLKAGEYGFAPIPLVIGALAAWAGWQRWRRRPSA